MARLRHFRPIIKNAIEAKWGVSPLSSLFEINETTELTAVQGLLYVSSRLKPTIFEEVNDKRTKTEASTYYEDDIAYFAEDESGRIEIQFEDRDKMYERYKVMSTGMAMGFLGFQYERSIFRVTDLCFPGNIRAGGVPSVRRRVFLASCIGMSNDNFNFEKMRIILHYLRTEDVEDFILMGGLLPSEMSGPGPALERLNVLCNITKTRLVLVPSQQDPTSKVFPQKPLHRKMFESSNPVLLPNPSVLFIEGARCLVSSGENIKDLLKYFPCRPGDAQGHHSGTDRAPGDSAAHSVENFLDAMESVMNCQYMCPTSPDTLKSEPVGAEDPFILREHCSMFFCGGAPEAGVRTMEGGTRLVAVPSFERSGSVMLFDTLASSYELVLFEG
ncbi:UNVERIFIED_CONTAM: hypothetical protein PYX00_011899 [Menopon gallinae]|uniref:DNA polymerase delta subunit 2 n=1 Tax=Menopon gallinae TaxID=328185 RepID=A0AAW2H8Z0_9NEOP